MNAPVLAFDRVSVRYEPHASAVLRDVSFSLERGERVALLGLNGSGKTTLLASAVGLVQHEGAIHVCGSRLSAATLSQVRDQVGFLFNVPEDQLLFPRVIDDVAFGLLRRGVKTRDAHARAREILDALGVSETAEVSLYHLSHGQKQRVALAGALVTRPALLLLDEPSAGLDPVGKQSLVELLRALEATMLVATHDFDFVSRFSTRFMLLEQGKVILDGPDGTEISRRWGVADAPSTSWNAQSPTPART